MTPKMDNNQKKISFTTSEEIHKLLLLWADKRKVSLSEAIRKILEDNFKRPHPYN